MSVRGKSRGKKASSSEKQDGEVLTKPRFAWNDKNRKVFLDHLEKISRKPLLNRPTVSELANEMGCVADTIRREIRRLEESGAIESNLLTEPPCAQKENLLKTAESVCRKRKSRDPIVEESESSAESIVSATDEEEVERRSRPRPPVQLISSKKEEDLI